MRAVDISILRSETVYVHYFLSEKLKEEFPLSGLINSSFEIFSRN